ncbi:MAG: aminotransferase class I/II-fold pyridoxal phosphate-dependent enzyme [Candidatus Lindowbacteria bacterium]|nr:aminotransferase class I/II-fold pyridoxal phosphate-dependent enzyme [Candidatus Lindowbacteria bacterium]
MPQTNLHPRTGLIDASGIRKVFDLAAQLEDPINLSIGQPDFDTPEEVKAAAIKAIKDGKNSYTVTQGTGLMREAIQASLKTSRSVDYDLDQVLITSGVSGGLMLAFMSLFGEGDEVIVPDPYFVMYKHLLRLLGAKPVYANIYPDFQLTAEIVEPLITEKTKAIITASPSNPTGAVMSSQCWKELISLADKRGLLIISDEIYDSFVYDEEFYSPATDYDNLLLLGGFSKSHAMTGWRLGYATGPKDLISAMTMLQQFTFVCAPSMAQEAGLVALETSTDAKRIEYAAKRDKMVNALSDKYEINGAHGAFYLFPKVPTSESGTEFCTRAINDQQLLMIPGCVFSETDTHFRISYAASEEVLNRGVHALLELAQ